MTKTETIAEGVTLYLGDCREIMGKNAWSFDAVITDPPFNAGKEFSNDNLTADEWRLFCREISTCFHQLEAKNYLIEVGKNDTEMRAALDAVLPYRSALVLNYTNAMRQGPCGYSNFGLVYWYGSKCFKRYMDRIDAALESTIDQFSHPSPKEIRHYAKLVDMFTPDGGSVFDPFMGSGTTGIAAVKLGRQFIGIDIEPKYFDIACRRIEEATRQSDLFVDKPKPAVQLGLLGQTHARETQEASSPPQAGSPAGRNGQILNSESRIRR